jgi:Plant transposon protein
LLLKLILDGSFSHLVDFPYDVGGKSFNQLWLLVDGIYPEVSCFVKTIDEPIDAPKGLYTRWQEASRKDVERAFGVLQRKFQVLRKPMEWWFLNDIKEVVESTIILHNMMVEERVKRDETENNSVYLFDGNDLLNGRIIDDVVEDIERVQAKLELNRRMDAAYYTGEAININELDDANRKAFFSFHHQCCLQ